LPPDRICISKTRAGRPIDPALVIGAPALRKPGEQAAIEARLRHVRG